MAVEEVGGPQQNAPMIRIDHLGRPFLDRNDDKLYNPGDILLDPNEMAGGGGMARNIAPTERHIIDTEA
jgi:hypothetical protein